MTCHQVSSLQIRCHHLLSLVISCHQVSSLQIGCHHLLSLVISCQLGQHLFPKPVSPKINVLHKFSSIKLIDLLITVSYICSHKTFNLSTFLRHKIWLNRWKNLDNIITVYKYLVTRLFISRMEQHSSGYLLSERGQHNLRQLLLVLVSLWTDWW